MEDVFERIGFASAEAGVGTLFVLVIILFVICIALIIGIITLLVRKRDFSNNIAGIGASHRVQKSGRSGRISNENVEQLVRKQRNLTKNIDDIYRKLSKTYQKVGIVKYNAYTNMSGNVSFVIAMLDETDSGFIVNVINGKEGSHTYIKDITEGESNESLGDEEAHALLLAISPESR